MTAASGQPARTRPARVRLVPGQEYEVIYRIPGAHRYLRQFRAGFLSREEDQLLFDARGPRGVICPPYGGILVFDRRWVVSVRKVRKVTSARRRDRRAPVPARWKPIPERCGKPMERRFVDRERSWDDPDPVCGRPAGYPPHCASEESYERELSAKHSDQQRAVRRARYAAARAAGLSRADALRYVHRTSLTSPAQMLEETRLVPGHADAAVTCSSA